MKGFSFIELIITVTIVVVMSAISLPLFKEYQNRASIAAAITDLRNFEVAFNAYLVENSTLPNDTHITIPPGMEGLIDAASWAETPLGGSYNWEGPDAYPYAGIAFYLPTANMQTFLALDQRMDDGSLFSGKFIIGTNGRYVYRIN